MICKKCGLENENTSNFCAYCGNKLQLEIINDINSETFNDLIVGKKQKKSLELLVEEKEFSQNSVNVSNNTGEVRIKEKKLKPNKKIIFIISVVILISLVALLFIFNNNNNNKYITVLDDSIKNLKSEFNSNIILNANVSIEPVSGNSINFSSFLKQEKKFNEKFYFQLHMDKSLIFDDTNIYGIKNQNEFTIFLNSNLIDKLNDSSTANSIWLYYIMSIPTIQQTNLNLKEILNKENFIYIDKENEIEHYRLFIDENFISNLKNQMQDIDNYINDFLEKIDNKIIIDLYIKDKKKIEKIKIDLSEYLKNTKLKKIIIELQLQDLGDSKIEIPEEAKTTKMDLDTFLFQNN